MSCCEKPSHIATAYYKERDITQVTEVMCAGCLNFISIQDVKNKRGKHEVQKEAGDERQSDTSP